MEQSIQTYIDHLESTEEQKIGHLLQKIIDQMLPEANSKIWHALPVWFIEENPIVGFSKQKRGMRLMFWSGADFEEANLSVRGKKFKDASIFYQSVDEINLEDLNRWLHKSVQIQWDYKNLVKRKGKLEKLMPNPKN
ncbi:DUF1801 domain-containing protein [Moheibacter stercoris]|uniref:Uncharacterized protein YdhG (YjbR/CyaY superfamily) n=1 Tax=Moheibacter stercoris TaxID=1628251 RepID=A0ABV2LVS5_9FLAO